jgi:signal transduction histidine kinase
LNALIQDLFEISVLEARKVDLIVERVTLGEWRRHLLEQYEMELEQKGLRFDCRLESSAISSLAVSVDLPRMNRVFANLVYNAVRYTPAGGRIAIAIDADVPQGVVKVVLTDSGIGIDPDDLPHLFDRFYKSDKSRHSHSGGSGLGLAIVKEIVELHGGTIGAYNTPEGGCAFELRLPLAGAEAKHAG